MSWKAGTQANREASCRPRFWQPKPKPQPHDNTTFPDRADFVWWPGMAELPAGAELAAGMEEPVAALAAAAHVAEPGAVDPAAAAEEALGHKSMQ